MNLSLARMIGSQVIHTDRWHHPVRIGTILGLMLLPVGCATRHSGNRATSEPPVWVEANLRTVVAKLAGEIGERNLYHPEKLEQSATWIEQQLQALGYEVRRQAIAVDTNVFRCAGATAYNLEAVLVGNRHPEKNIVIGAHYDSKVATPGYRDRWPPLPDRPGTPGANDNASGVAALLSIARSLAAQPCASTLRFVFFANEEPPFFKQPSAMGSYQYAAELKAKGVKVEAMLSLEILGCYSKRPSLSSAVRKTVVRICRGLRISSPRFLHYIFACVLNGATLLGQVQVQSLQEFSHHPLRSCHCAQTQFTDVLADLDRQDHVQ